MKKSNGLKKITIIVSFVAFALLIFAPPASAVISSVSSEASPKPSLSSKVCAQVITNAKSSFGECKAFSTPCDVPEDWTVVSDCSSTNNSVKPLPASSGKVCAAVITNAKSSSGACKAFPTPCDVPEGWTIVRDCSSNLNSEISPKPLVGDIKIFLEKMRLSLKEFMDKKTSEEFDKAAILKEKLVSKKKVIQDRIDAAKKSKEEKRKQVLIHLIDLEIKHFSNTAERVAKMPNITDEIKAQLKAAIDSAVQKLNEEKIKVQTAASDEDVKTLAQETKDLFKTHREIVKKIVAAIHASKESELISKAEDRTSVIETKIRELKAQGKNVSELETILASAKADIAAAKEKLSQKLFSEANGLLKSAYDKFKTIAEKAKAL